MNNRFLLKNEKASWVSLAMSLALMGGGSWIRAEPGDGLVCEPFVLHPFVEIAVTYDTNPSRATDDADADSFLDASAGARMGYSALDLDARGQFYVGTRKYIDLTDESFATGGEVVSLRYGARETGELEFSQSFRRIEDLDRFMGEGSVGGVSPDSILDAGVRDRRDLNELGLKLARELSDKLGLEIGYRFSNVDYDSSRLSDCQTHQGEMEAAYRATDKTDTFLSVLFGAQDLTESDESSVQSGFRAGLKSCGSDRLTYKVGAGLKNFSGQAGVDNRAFFHYDATVLWKATDKVTGQMGARNGAVVSSLYADNSTEYMTFWVGPRYHWTPEVSLSANLTYREDDYIEPFRAGTQFADRKDEGVGGRLRADYFAARKFLNLYAEAMYETVDSTVVSSYDDTRLTVGVSLQY